MPEATRSGPKVLGFSTAGPYCSVALFSGGDVISARHEDLSRGQAERLMPIISEVLANAQLSTRDLDAIGVGIGPGNFTGIRISVAAARGLTLGLGIPSVGVSQLEALALDNEGPVLASVTAGRDGYYLQRFGTGVERGPEHVTLEALQDWALPSLTCIGNDAEAIAQRINARFGPAAHDPASAIARIAAQRYQTPSAAPAPLYLRAADAAPARDAPPRIVP